MPEQMVKAVPEMGSPVMTLIFSLVSLVLGFAASVINTALKSKEGNKPKTLPPPRPESSPGNSEEILCLVKDIHHDRDGRPRWLEMEKLSEMMAQLVVAQQSTNTKMDTLIELEKEQNRLLHQAILHSHSGEHDAVTEDDG